MNYENVHNQVCDAATSQKPDNIIINTIAGN